MDRVRVELERLLPDELLYSFFGERWLLEVEAERRWADRRVRHLSHEGMPGMGGIEPHQLQFHKRKSIKGHLISYHIYQTEKGRISNDERFFLSCLDEGN